MPDSPNLVDQIVVVGMFDGTPQPITFTPQDARAADELILRALLVRRSHVLDLPGEMPADHPVMTRFGPRTIPGFMYPYEADVVGDDAVPLRVLRGFIDLRGCFSMCASMARVSPDAIAAPFRE